MGWRGGLRGKEGRGIVRKCNERHHNCPGAHILTKERSDCSVDPHCSKYVGQSDVEGVLCAGLQSHDVEETAISHNLVGRVEGAVNEDSDISGVLWVGQVELHTRTAHWDINRVQFSGRSSDVGRGYKGGYTTKGGDLHKNTSSSLSAPYIHYSQGTITSTDTGSLVPTEFTANALRVTLSPLVKFTLSWLSSKET